MYPKILTFNTFAMTQGKLRVLGPIKVSTPGVATPDVPTPPPVITYVIKPMMFDISIFQRQEQAMKDWDLSFIPASAAIPAFSWDAFSAKQLVATDAADISASLSYWGDLTDNAWLGEVVSGSDNVVAQKTYTAGVVVVTVKLHTATSILLGDIQYIEVVLGA